MTRWSRWRVIVDMINTCTVVVCIHMIYQYRTEEYDQHGMDDMLNEKMVEELVKRKEKKREENDEKKSDDKQEVQPEESNKRHRGEKTQDVACTCDRHPVNNVSYLTIAECIALGSSEPWLKLMSDKENPFKPNTHHSNWPHAGFHK